MSDEKVVVAVDAMGGDDAPAWCRRRRQALASDPALEIVLCGPADVVEPFAAAHERCTPQACSEVIAMAEHPANAVRKKKDSSIVVGCRLVKEGAAQGFFSAGSTGACLAAGTLVMGRIKGVARPALATVIPSPVRRRHVRHRGERDCKPEYLVQFGQMASIYAEKVIGIEHPRAALLNIGEEDTKGSQFAQEAHGLLRERLSNFAGNAEGSDILPANFDVIITDGFTGNVCMNHRGHVEDPVQDAQEHHDVHTAHEAGRSGHKRRLEAAHGAGEPRYVRRRPSSGREGRASGGARLVQRAGGEERRADHGSHRANRRI